MKTYKKDIALYFELKDSPISTRESYSCRVDAFIQFVEKRKKIEDVNYSDIQQYILYLKREKGLSAGTINTYISSPS